MRPDPPFVAIRPRTSRMGCSLVHLPEAKSTMAEMRSRAMAGAKEGYVVVADRQTAGVGRRGRTWTSVGSSLAATVLLRPQVPGDRLQLLPLAAGVAMAESARKLLKVELRLKWPNDLLHGDRKVGGTIVDAVYSKGNVPDMVFVGVGVNGDAREDEFPRELREVATSLSVAAGTHVCLPALLKLFLESFEPRYDAIVRQETKALWAEARALLKTIGRRVRVHTADGVVEGDAVDLGPDGELLVRTGATVHTVRAGDCQELRYT